MWKCKHSEEIPLKENIRECPILAEFLVVTHLPFLFKMVQLKGWRKGLESINQGSLSTAVANLCDLYASHVHLLFKVSILTHPLFIYVTYVKS